MDHLTASVERFANLDRHGSVGESFYHKVISSIHDLCFHIANAEVQGYDRSAIEEIVQPAYVIHGRSPFLHRAQTWPRGYPGDFETIEYLCAARNQAPPGTIAFYCEQYALNSAIAQQHRNKVHYQSHLILDTVLHLTHRPKILSIACGSCHDIAAIAPYVRTLPCDFVLNDIDDQALVMAKGALAQLGDSCTYVHGNILRLLGTLEHLGPFDLIFAGGLFDYLPSKHIQFILKYAHDSLLAEHGTLLFTNIATGNPYRVWIEYLMDWKLIERSEDELINLAGATGFEVRNTTIVRDTTGLTYLVTVTR